MKLLKFTIILLLASCSAREAEKQDPTPEKAYANVNLMDKNDTLFAFREGVEQGYGAGSSCGYVNKKGDTVIPMNRYTNCFTDTFRTYAIVTDEKLEENPVGINRKGEVIFEAYLFDNWPDDPSEGLFRIRRNGKIGFANLDGEVVIEPKYKCAFPFENNQAKVALNCESSKDDIEHVTWESDAWFYIDREGNKVK